MCLLRKFMLLIATAAPSTLDQLVMALCGGITLRIGLGGATGAYWPNFSLHKVHAV